MSVEVGGYVLNAVLAPYIAALLVLLLHRAPAPVVAWTGVAGLAVSAFSSVVALVLVGPEGAEPFTVYWLPSFNVAFSLRADFLALAMGALVAVLSLIIGIYSVEYIGSWGAPRYWFFFCFFVGSMQTLVYANDLYTLLVGWEGTGLASYALISFYHDDRETDWVGDPGRRALGVPMWSPPTHSGIRAITFTKFADAAMLVAIGFIHAVVGTTLMDVLEPEAGGFERVLGAAQAAGALLPFLFAFYVGALAKSAQMPFHEWLVTAMTGPAPVSALIHAATMVKAGVYYALRFTPWLVSAAVATGLAAQLGAFLDALLWLVLITAFALATMALVARELKLILAYSTASQLSYMFAAVFAASLYALASQQLEAAQLGVYSGFAHLVSHAVFKAALFLAAGALIHAVHSRYITDMGGLAGSMPLTFLATLMAGLSLAAVPPFSGWWSKDAVVYVLKLAGPHYAALALVTAFLTAAYTTRMITYVFSEKPLGRRAHGHEPGWLMKGAYLALGLASLALGAAWYWAVEPALAEGFGVHPKLDPLGLAIGTLAASGGAVVGASYLAGLRPWTLIERSAVLRTLHGFLYDRWYVNAAIYRALVYPGATLAQLLRSAVEAAVDRFYHISVPRAAVETGLAARSLHQGSLPAYVAYMLLGLLTALVVAAYAGGWP